MKTADRIKARREELGLSEPEVCTRAGLAKTYIRDLRTGRKKSLKMDTARKIAEVLEVSPEWLFSGDIRDAVAFAPLTLGGEDNIVTIPVYDITASAGPGSIVEDGEPVGHYPLALEDLQRMTRTASQHIAALEVRGDSMEPDLRHGDRIVIDRTVTRFIGEFVYVLERSGVLLVKKLSPNFKTNQIRIISSNSSFETDEIDEEDLRIVGKVFMLARAIG